MFDKLICTLNSNYVGSNCFMGDTFILSSCYAKKNSISSGGGFDMINETKHVLTDIFIFCFTLTNNILDKGSFRSW